MKKPNEYPGVTRTKDRHGRERFRFKTKRNGGFSCYLPGAWGSPEFRAAYKTAYESRRTPASVAPAGSVGWVITQYLSTARVAELSDARRKTLRHELDWLRGQAGDLPLSRMEVQHVEALMRRKPGPTAANTVRKNLSMLFNFAGRPKKAGGLGLRVDNPARFAAPRKTPGGGYHTATAAEMAKFLAHWGPGTKARLVFLLAQNTGAARIDLTKLKRSDISDGFIHYARQKTGQAGTYPIQPELQAELDRLPADQDHLVVQDDSPRPYAPESLGNLFGKWADAAGVPGVSIHGVRKGQATAFAEAGSTEHEVMSYLAHKTTAEARTYTQAASRKTLTNSAFDRSNSRIGLPQESNQFDGLAALLMQRFDTMEKKMEVAARRGVEPLFSG